MPNLPRKVLRKQQERQLKLKRLKKNVALTSSAMALAGVLVPLATTHQVSAAKSTVSSAKKSKAAFINEVASYAAKCANENDLYASVMIAQAILESGWGNSGLASAPNYNLFGIKGNYNGQSVYMNTKEYLNGRWVTIKAGFRKYPSYYESFVDNARVLKTTSFSKGKYFYAGAWKSNTKNYRDATKYLTGRYATAPNYNTLLNQIIESYNLTRFDTPSNGPTTTIPTPDNITSTTPNKPTTNNQTYKVVSGDSVWGISHRFGISMATLVSQNNIKNNLIHPGQVLIIKKGTTTTTPTKPVKPTKPQETVKPSKPTTNNQTYKVVSGDSVWGISHRFGISMATLVSQNNIKNNLIHPGQVLIIKKGTTTTTPTKPVKPTKPQETVKPSKPTTNNQTYKVVSGDSVWGISHRFGISMATLVSQNNIKNNLIHPGQVLIIKKGTTTTTTPTKPVTPTKPQETVKPEKPTTPSKPVTTQKTYKVKAGDSLWKIANQHHISLQSLLSYNKISQNHMIHPGDVLKVSAATTNTAKPETKPAAKPSQTSQNYVVKKGDTLWHIAKKHGLSVNQLKNLNHLTSDFIYVNQNLKVK